MRKLILSLWLVIALTVPAMPADAAKTVTESTAVQAFSLKGYRFNIPKAFLTPFQRSQVQGMKDRVSEEELISLHMRFPRMLPQTPEGLSHMPDMPEPSHHISVQLDTTKQISATFDGESMKELRRKGLCRAQKFMETCPPHENNIWQINKDIYLINYPNDFVFCSRIENKVRPHCDYEQIILDHIALKISFDRLLLDDVIAIRDQILRRVCSWLDLPKDRALAVNHCLTSGQ